MPPNIIGREDIPGVTYEEKKMFNVRVSQAGNVNVMTSDKGGLTNEQIS